MAGHSCRDMCYTGLSASLPNLAKPLLDRSKSQCFLLVVCQAFYSHGTRIFAVPLSSHGDFATRLVKRLLASACVAMYVGRSTRKQPPQDGSHTVVVSGAQANTPDSEARVKAKAKRG